MGTKAVNTYKNFQVLPVNQSTHCNKDSATCSPSPVSCSSLEPDQGCIFLPFLQLGWGYAVIRTGGADRCHL